MSSTKKTESPNPSPVQKKKIPTDFCCGTCSDPFTQVQFFKLSCMIHYACSKEHQTKGCSICVCDYCDQQIETSPFCVPCGDIYHSTCFAKYVGADKFNKECVFCDEEVQSGNILSINGSGPSKISSLFANKLMKKDPSAPLTPKKLERLRKRSWTADTINRKSRYTLESIVMSEITYSQLVEFGFSLRHFKEKGFDFNTMFLQYVKSGQMTSLQIKEVIEFFQPGFKQLMVTTGFMIEIDDSKQPGDILHHLKENFGLTVGDLYRVGLRNRRELITCCPLSEWQRCFPKKEVATYILPLCKEDDQTGSSTTQQWDQQQNNNTRSIRTLRRVRDGGDGNYYPLTTPANGTFAPKTVSWM